MKKLLILFTAAALCLSFAACGGSSSGSTSSSASKKAETSSATISNPWTDCDSLDDAIKVSGVDITVPASIDGYPNIVYRAMKNSMIEIIYKNGNEEIRVRKASGSDDISGDYNTYDQSQKITAHNTDVTLKGSKDKVSLALWQKSGSSFSVSFSPSVTSEYAQNIVSQIS
jgi:ABC-type glycerol-3-phosphate transport system substrate-binding protein